MPELILYSSMCDYITITSYDKDFAEHTAEWLRSSMTSDSIETKRLRYRGYAWENSLGNAFVGEGRQGGKRHFIMTVSGSLAHYCMMDFVEIFNKFDCSCSRFDCQISIDQDDTWSQKDLRNRLEQSGQRVGFPTPSLQNGRTLETVYVGVRTKSDRFIRIYQKLSSSDTYVLRLEVETKKRRSKAIMMAIASDYASYRKIMESELRVACLRDERLQDAFEDYLTGERKPERVRVVESNTEHWILSVCMPAIRNYLNDHETQKFAVLGEIYQIMEDYHEKR